MVCFINVICDLQVVQAYVVQFSMLNSLSRRVLICSNRSIKHVSSNSGRVSIYSKRSVKRASSDSSESSTRVIFSAMVGVAAGRAEVNMMVVKYRDVSHSRRGPLITII